MRKLGSQSYKFLIFFFALFLSLGAHSQELNVKVEVLAPQVPNANKRIMEVIEKMASDFLNSRSWTGREVLPSERIDGNIVITIQSWDGSSEYVAQAQILSMRPVFGTNYNSPVFNKVDKNFNFSYLEGQVMDYSEQEYKNNFTSLLAYYAYMMIGMDADTFSPLGGNPYFQQAQAIVNTAQQGGNEGWRSFDGNDNRYWLAQNMVDRKFEALRLISYEYHRNGLDMLSSQMNQAQNALKNLLPEFKKIDRFGMGSLIDQVFFTTKSTELTGVYSGLPHQDRMLAFQTLVELDPANTHKYEALRNR